MNEPTTLTSADVLRAMEEMLASKPERAIGALQLHPDRIEDLLRTRPPKGDILLPPGAAIPGIEILSASYLPKNRGCALDTERKFLGVVFCDSSDPAEWRIVFAPRVVEPNS